jgi:hypothetical protein
MHEEDDILDRIWRAARPQEGDPLAEDRQAFIRSLRSRNRRMLLAALATGGALAAGTIVLVSGAVRQGEAALALLLLPCWIALIGLARAEWLHRRALPGLEGSILEALQARLDRNRRARLRVRGMALLHAASAPLWAWGIMHLASTGRLAPSELPSLVSVLAGLLLAAALFLAYREFAQLRPEADRLNRLLRSYAA